MQRLIWVKKRLWFALAMVGLIMAGHWYAISHPPQHTVLGPLQPETSVIGTVPAANGAEMESPSAEPESDDRSSPRNP